MVNLIQPQNRKKDIKAALDEYHGFIKHDEWFTEAFQKDLIQNSWGARQDKKHGKNWACKLEFDSKLFDGKGGIIATDFGTKGLTGRIPTDKAELLEIVKDKQSSDRLAFFLTSQWSEHEIGGGGSRGRGKMLLLAASTDYKFFFESLRFDDGKYIFGEMYLNSDMEVEENFEIGEKAVKNFKEKFPNFKILDTPGTKIFIVNPRDDLRKTFDDFTICNYISFIWWEILEKFEANITVIADKKEKKVSKSEWLPVEKIIAKDKHQEYPLIDIKDYGKIKKISLGFLGEKDISEKYKGIHIQRAGMIIESLKIYELTGESWNDKIYGTVELDQDLEEQMLECEGPEHYNFLWNCNPARKVKPIISQKILEVAKKNSLLKETPAEVKDIKEAENGAEKILNKLAKKLNLSGLSQKTGHRRGGKRGKDEKIRLSMKDFKLPMADNNRVDFGQSIEGICVTPINECAVPLKVLVRTYIFDKDDRVVISKEEEQNTGGKCESTWVGWDKLDIDEKKFKRGRYVFKAEMHSLEDTTIENMNFEKAKLIYHPVSRTFWVDQDPEEKGFFDIRRSNDEEKEKFFWWQNEGSGDRDNYVLYWNGAHPVFLQVLKDKSSLEKLLIDYGSLAAYSIVYSKAKQNESEFKNIYKKEDLQTDNFENIFKIIIKNWGAFLSNK